MSGICGILALDGGAPDRADLMAMTDALERRGPDGTSHWLEGPAALGHTLLATTPEALVERLPLTDPESGCTITADVRLDNREELLGLLGLDADDRVIGDGELILRAYVRWGEDCPRRLLGDFAFAIWDPRSEQLFCARDHMGMRQLIYHHAPGERFVFATEAEALLAHPAVPRRINERRIADFLANLEAADLTSTLYEKLCRLPPAHSLRVTQDQLSIVRYWTLERVPLLALPSDSAYAAAFLQIFTEAIQCRLRGIEPIGAMLSGGLDSGSIAAVASRLLAAHGQGPLRCFSAVGPEPTSCIETRCIHASASLAHIRTTYVDHGRLDEYAKDLRRLSQEAEPFDWHMTLVRAVYLAAHREGVKVMLDGVGGDSVTSPGNFIALLVRRGHLIRAAHEARSVARYFGPPVNPWRLLIGAAWAALAPGWLRRFRQSLRRRTPALENARLDRPYESAHRRRLATHPFITVARERYDRVASALAIEPRDPFLDIRLIAFFLSLPPEQLQRDGWPKLVVRHAMAGLLPDEVIWRAGKEHLGMQFTNALSRLCDASTAIRPEMLEPILRLNAMPFRAKSPVTEIDREQSFRLTILSTWLTRNKPKAESFER